MSKKLYSENGFIYTIDENGTISAEGKVPTQGVKCGSRVTPDGMLPGDQRGHVIAAQEAGPNKSYNMTAQDGKLNQGAYKTVENAEVDLARQGYDVQTSKTACVSTQNGGRPDAYIVNDTIITPDEKTQCIHLSFQNMSPEIQEALNKEVDEMNIKDDFDNPDPLRDSMTNDEYNALMQDTDEYSASVKNEFDMTNTETILFDESYTHEANNIFDAEASQIIDSNTSSVSDSQSMCDGCGCEGGLSVSE